MPNIPVRKISYKIQLTDALREQFPNESIIDLRIENLINFPDLQPNRFLRVNGRGDAIELVSSMTNSAFVIEFGNTFPTAPADNQLFILTEDFGSFESNIYLRQNDNWNSVLSLFSLTQEQTNTLTRLVNSVEYTQEEKTKLSNIEENAQANVGVEYTQLEKDKLANIEDNAKDDQTAIEIKDALESLTGDNRVDASAIRNLSQGTGLTQEQTDTLTRLEDSQEFSQEEKTKLSGIEDNSQTRNPNSITSVSLSNNVLTFLREDNSSLVIDLPQNAGNSIVGASLSENILTFTFQDGTTQEITLTMGVTRNTILNTINVLSSTEISGLGINYINGVTLSGRNLTFSFLNNQSPISIQLPESTSSDGAGGFSIDNIQRILQKENGDFFITEDGESVLY